MLATLGIMLWVPHATTNGAWIGSKILQGCVGAPIESLCEISITDIYFTHERGTYMGLYAFMLAGSNFLAPVFAGFINDGQGMLLPHNPASVKIKGLKSFDLVERLE